MNRIHRIITAAQDLAYTDAREVEFREGPPDDPSDVDWADIGDQCWDDVYLSDLLAGAKLGSISGTDLALARAEYIEEFKSYGGGLGYDDREEPEFYHS